MKTFIYIYIPSHTINIEDFGLGVLNIFLSYLKRDNLQSKVPSFSPKRCININYGLSAFYTLTMFGANVTLSLHEVTFGNNNTKILYMHADISEKISETDERGKYEYDNRRKK